MRLKSILEIPCGKSGERGFSLVGVIVAFALVIIGFSIFTSTFSTFFQVERTTRARKSVDDVESGLRMYVWQQLNQYVADTQCSTAKPPMSCYFDPSPTRPSQCVGTKPAPTVGLWGKPRYLVSSPKLGSDAPPRFGAASTRCGKPGLVNGNRFHFCLTVERVPTLTAADYANSFVASTSPFVEVSVQLNDVASGTPLGCASFKSSATAGARIDYGVYWGKPAANKKRTDYFSYIGGQYVGR